MSDHFFIEGPARVAFSGGRTPSHYPADPETGEIPERSREGQPWTVEVSHATATRRSAPFERKPFGQLIRWIEGYRPHVKGAWRMQPRKGGC